MFGRIFLLAILLLIGSTARASAAPIDSQDDNPYIDSKRVTEWIAQLEDGDENERLDAAIMLSQCDTMKATRAVSALVRAMDDSSGKVRMKAIQSLGCHNFMSHPAVPKLMAMVDDDDETVRLAVGDCLRRIGPEARAALPSLIEGVSKRGVDEFADAIYDIGPGALALLVFHIDNPNPDVRGVVTSALQNRRCFPGLSEYIKELLAALNHEDDRVRYVCARALARMKAAPSQVVPILRRWLADDPVTGLADSGVQFLKFYGPDAKEALPDLKKLLTVDSLRNKVARTIEAIER